MWRLELALLWYIRQDLPVISRHKYKTSLLIFYIIGIVDYKVYYAIAHTVRHKTAEISPRAAPVSLSSNFFNCDIEMTHG